MRTSLLSRDAAQLNAALAMRATRRTTRSTSLAADATTALPPSPPPTRKRKQTSDAPTTVAAESSAVVTATLLAPRQPAPKARRGAKAVKSEDGAVHVAPPPDWEEVYRLTEQMRVGVPAPVDTMGCATLADRSATPRDQRFQTLVALMLSSQTKDTVTAVAIQRLKDEVPGGFNLEGILALPATQLNDCIAKVGFHNLKTQYIKRTAAILRDEHGSDIPDTIAGLTSLPGVGPKMAYLCLSAAWDRDEGIGVDVHVHRITNLWRWHKTKTPEETRAALESWLPREKWRPINPLLVGFGQTICVPVRPRCEDCTLAERGLCPSAKVPKGKARAVKREAAVVQGDEGELAIKTETTDEAVVMASEPTMETENIEEKGLVDIEDIGLANPRSSRKRRL